jgi:excisionase family DNA binding protein
MSPKFLTVNEVAEVLRVSKITIWRYIEAGTLPAYKVGRDWRIEQSEFDKFLESRRSTKKDEL